MPLVDLLVLSPLDPFIFFHSSSLDSTNDTNGLCAGLGDENGLTLGDCLGEGTVSGFINPVTELESAAKGGGSELFDMAVIDEFN